MCHVKKNSPIPNVIQSNYKHNWDENLSVSITVMLHNPNASLDLEKLNSHMGHEIVHQSTKKKKRKETIYGISTLCNLLCVSYSHD